MKKPKKADKRKGTVKVKSYIPKNVPRRNPPADGLWNANPDELRRRAWRMDDTGRIRSELNLNNEEK